MNLRKLEANLNRLYEKIPNNRIRMLLGIFCLLLVSFGAIDKTILYIGLYLGIVFLIASAAVLALQQLSEASDIYGILQFEEYHILYNKKL